MPVSTTIITTIATTTLQSTTLQSTTLQSTTLQSTTLQSTTFQTTVMTVTAGITTVGPGQTVASFTVGPQYTELYVASGGMVGSVKVQAGAELYVASGGGVTVAAVTTGATAAMAPGAKVGMLTFAGGTLELASGSGGSAGAVALTPMTGTISTVQVDSGAAWTVDGTSVLLGTAPLSTLAAAPILSNSGLLDLPGGLIVSAVTGFGTVTLGPSAVLGVEGTVGSGQTIAFGNDSYLELATPDAFAGTLSGLGNAQLYLDNFFVTSDSYANGELLITGVPSRSAPVAFSYHLSNVPSGALFSFTNLSNDVALITEIPACFTRGTAIMGPAGERPIEALAIGDDVLTVHGRVLPVRWIGRRSYAGRFLAGKRHLLPVLFRAGSLGGGLPRRDLRVSPMHAMFLDGVLVPAGLLVNGAGIVVEYACQRIDYIHLELDHHDLILAEGAASESFVDDDSRGVFHNASEWQALYPDLARVPPLYCAPRVESGFELEAIRSRLATRPASDGLGGDPVRAVDLR